MAAFFFSWCIMVFKIEHTLIPANCVDVHLTIHKLLRVLIHGKWWEY